MSRARCSARQATARVAVAQGVEIHPKRSLSRLDTQRGKRYLWGPRNGSIRRERWPTIWRASRSSSSWPCTGSPFRCGRRTVCRAISTPVISTSNAGAGRWRLRTASGAHSSIFSHSGLHGKNGKTPSYRECIVAGGRNGRNLPFKEVSLAWYNRPIRFYWSRMSLSGERGLWRLRA